MRGSNCASCGDFYAGDICRCLTQKADSEFNNGAYYKFAKQSGMDAMADMYKKVYQDLFSTGHLANGKLIHGNTKINTNGKD